LLVKFPDNPTGANYDIWDSDYNTFALVYSCEQVIPEVKIEFLWILARQVNGVSEDKIAELKSLAQKYGIKTSKFVKGDYSKC
jgi:lipocalin